MLSRFYQRLGRAFGALGLLLCLAAAGCGGSKTENVDLAGELAKLSGDADAKVGALAKIAELGPGAKGAVEKLIPLLKDEDASVRRTAAYALGSIGPAAKAAIPELKALLQTTDKDQLTAAANAMSAIDPASVEGVKINNTSN